MPPAFTVNALSHSTGIKRRTIYAALRAGALIAYRIGVRRFILTGTTDDPGTIVHWIASHPRVMP
jgi:hypothetical protein